MAPRPPWKERERALVETADDALDLLQRGLRGDGPALDDALVGLRDNPDAIPARHSDGELHQLESLARAVMPFGRFAGQRIIELPEEYLLWFAREGFPSGRLGQQMAAAYEIRRAGLEALVLAL